MANVIPFPGVYKQIKELAVQFCTLLDKGDTASAESLLRKEKANLGRKELEILRGYINEFRRTQRKSVPR